MYIRSLALAAATVALLASGVASAAPTTVQLRVEGSTATLFEGPVTTDGVNGGRIRKPSSDASPPDAAGTSTVASARVPPTNSATIATLTPANQSSRFH